MGQVFSFLIFSPICLLSCDVDRCEPPSAPQLPPSLPRDGGGPASGHWRLTILHGRLSRRPLSCMVLEIKMPRTTWMSLSFSRKEETAEGQAIPGLAGAEERHPADERAHGGDPGGGRRRHGAVPWGRGRPEVHPHGHEHGESLGGILTQAGSASSWMSALPLAFLRVGGWRPSPVHPRAGNWSAPYATGLARRPCPRVYLQPWGLAVVGPACHSLAAVCQDLS